MSHLFTKTEGIHMIRTSNNIKTEQDNQAQEEEEREFFFPIQRADLLEEPMGDIPQFWID